MILMNDEDISAKKKDNKRDEKQKSKLLGKKGRTQAKRYG